MTGEKRPCDVCGTPIPEERRGWDNECPNPHCESRAEIRADGGVVTLEQVADNSFATGISALGAMKAMSGHPWFGAIVWATGAAAFVSLYQSRQRGSNNEQ